MPKQATVLGATLPPDIRGLAACYYALRKADAAMLHIINASCSDAAIAALDIWKEQLSVGADSVAELLRELEPKSISDAELQAQTLMDHEFRYDVSPQGIAAIALRYQRAAARLGAMDSGAPNRPRLVAG